MKENIDKNKVMQMYKNKIPVAQIATELRCSASGIYRILRRTKCYVPENRKIFDDNTEAIIVDLYKNGSSIKTLSNSFNCHANTINNLLHRHHCSFRKQGRPSSGGKWNHAAGYTYISIPKDDEFYCMVNFKGYVAEHRYVVAKKLGRPLDKKESVHHIDGSRKNNEIDNLQLRSSSHGAGVVHVCQNCGSKNVKAVNI